MTALVVFAHPGHWAVQVLYLAPLAALVIMLVVSKVRERRKRRARPDDAD